MAVSKTTRMELTRWSADADAFTRGQMDSSHEALEEFAAKYSQGSALPTANAVWEKSFFYNTTDETLYFFVGNDEDGTWEPVGTLSSSTPAALTLGASGSAGVSTVAARSDHVHALPAASSANTASALVQRDASGNFSAGTVTVNALSATTSVTAADGTSSAPSVRFSTGSTTGLSFDSSNGLQVSVGGGLVARFGTDGHFVSNANNTRDVGTSAVRWKDGWFAGTVTAGTFSGSGASLTNIPNSAVGATHENTASAIVARNASGNFTAGTITATLSGNASTASQWATARTITLGSQLTGSTSIDGSANVTLNATLASSATPTIAGLTVTNVSNNAQINTDRIRIVNAGAASYTNDNAAIVIGSTALNQTSIVIDSDEIIARTTGLFGATSSTLYLNYDKDSVAGGTVAIGSGGLSVLTNVYAENFYGTWRTFSGVGAGDTQAAEAAGWDVTDYYARRSGDLLQFRVIASRTGGTISVPANGDITNVTVATLGADAHGNLSIAQPIYGSGAGGRICSGSINPATGVIQLTAVSGGADIVNGNQITLAGFVWVG